MEPIIIVLLIIAATILLWLGYKLGSIVTEQEWLTKLPKIRESAVKKSREVLTGKFSEQLAPYLPDFPYSPTECKFIGKPIDLIVFKGLDKKEPDEVIFVEVKSGESKLSTVERKLRDVIKDKKSQALRRFVWNSCFSLSRSRPPNRARGCDRENEKHVITAS